MYSSLERIDMQRGNRYVQTDHRNAEEIEAEPEVSVLFALTRVINARERGKQETESPVVVYACAYDELPQFFLDTLSAAGALLEPMSTMKAVALPAVSVTTGDLADKAFRELSARICNEGGYADPKPALEALQAESRANPRSHDQDGEIGYWTRVVELLAVFGEVLRAQYGGRWIDAPDAPFLPFEFVAAGVPIRAAQYALDIAGGSTLPLLTLLQAVEKGKVRNEELEKAPILCNLRSRREATAMKMAWRPLLKNAPADEDFPVIVYGRDTPKQFAIRMADDAGDLDALHAEALVNLAKQEVQVQQLDPDNPMVVVTGSYYASEKVLDRAFMRTLHERLGTPRLLAAAPGRGRLFVTTNEPPLERVAGLLRLAHFEIENNPKPISTRILFVSDGEIVGHVEPVLSDAAEPEPKKRGLFSRLFKKS